MACGTQVLARLHEYERNLAHVNAVIELRQAKAAKAAQPQVEAGTRSAARRCGGVKPPLRTLSPEGCGSSHAPRSKPGAAIVAIIAIAAIAAIAAVVAIAAVAALVAAALVALAAAAAVRPRL